MKLDSVQKPQHDSTETVPIKPQQGQQPKQQKQDSKDIPQEILQFRLYTKLLLKKNEAKNNLKILQENMQAERKQIELKQKQLDEREKNLSQRLQNIQRNQRERQPIKNSDFHWNEKRTLTAIMVCLLVFVLRFWVTNVSFWQVLDWDQSLTPENEKQCLIRHSEVWYNEISSKNSPNKQFYIYEPHVLNKSFKLGGERGYSVGEEMKKKHGDAKINDRVNRKLYVNEMEVRPGMRGQTHEWRRNHEMRRF